MARIRGTSGDDSISGTDGHDIIWAGAGNDEVESYDGNDILRGGWGDDHLLAFDGGKLYGGLGNDTLGGSGLRFIDGVWQGVGDGWLVGGWGDDRVSGVGHLFGDGGPKDGPLIAGNDVLSAFMGSTMTGGLGNDTFLVTDFLPAQESVAEVMDFTPGQDKVGLLLDYGNGTSLTSAQLWGIFDTNADGKLDGTDTPWDANSQTYADPTANTLTIRLCDDLLVIHGTTQIQASDWVFS